MKIIYNNAIIFKQNFQFYVTSTRENIMLILKIF